MMKAVHRSFQRSSNECKLFTPQRTEATEGGSNCRQAFQNGSFGYIEQSSNIRHSSVFANQSIVSFTCAEINNEDILEFFREMEILQFLSVEVKQNVHIIQQKQKLVQVLKIQREDKQHRIQSCNQRYQRHRKTLSATKQKITRNKRQTSHSIDQKIQRLKSKIDKMKSVCSERNHSFQKEIQNFSPLNSVSQIGYNKKEYSHRRFYTDVEPICWKPDVKQHKRKRKIYIPIYVPSGGPQLLNSACIWQQNHPDPYNRYSPQPYAPRVEPNLAESPKTNKYTPNQYLEQSFTQKLKVFTSRLEGGLSSNSKKNSELQYSQSRRSKRSSLQDKGSYIFSDIRASNKSNTKVKHQQQFFQEDDQEGNQLYNRSGYSKMGFKVTTSNTQDTDSIEYPPLRKKPTQEKKGNSIPIIEEINNSTVYVDILSEKREHSSSDKDTIEKKYSTGRSYSKKQNAEQSAVDIDANILDMLQHSPIKQQTELSSSPQSFRMRAKEEQLGESFQGQPLIKLQLLQQLNRNQTIEFNYLKQPSITSKYESTSRRLAETKQEEHNTHFSNIQDNLNILDIVRLNPISRISREAKSSEEKASDFGDEEEDDLLKSIKLSTESIFSRGKKYNNSAIHESKRSSQLGEREISQSDIKDSKKVRQTMVPPQRRSEELDLAQQIRTTTPSRIVKGGLIKKRFKRDNQLMKQSIEEANEDEQDPISGKIRAKKSKGSAQGFK